MVEYQGITLIPLATFTHKAKVVDKIEEMLHEEETLVVDRRGAFFDFKGRGGEKNYYLYYVYGYNGRFPRFLTCLKRIVNRKGRTIKYELTSKL
ncbi:hypothetical protein A3K73_00630 [Candidatus Pacearchaeota archaeon RBG_13_36_9]|nr:MAG: hypothetical protein A3K73_00630 [Candidatus Pacearchaeota archaeon RBG_13_36_9]